MATTGVEAESDTAKLIKATAAANKKSSNDENKGKITDKEKIDSTVDKISNKLKTKVSSNAKKMLGRLF